MMKKVLFLAVSICLVYAAHAFAAMDKGKAEALVKEYIQALSHPKEHELAVGESITMDNIDAALYKTHVQENADFAVFMADGFYKTTAISEKKLPKEEFFITDDVSPATEQKIVASKVEKDHCMVTVEIVNREGKLRVRNTYKVVEEQGKYRIYPSSMKVYEEGGTKQHWIDAYQKHEELKYE